MLSKGEEGESEREVMQTQATSSVHTFIVSGHLLTYHTQHSHTLVPGRWENRGGWGRGTIVMTGEARRSEGKSGLLKVR